MTPQEWNEQLARHVHWEIAYALIAKITREHLMSYEDGEYISTHDLVEELYPAAQATTDDAAKARERIFRGLAQLAKPGRALADCAQQGVARARYGKMVRPLEWFKPATTLASLEGMQVLYKPPEEQKPLAAQCPHCGEDIF